MSYACVEVSHSLHRLSKCDTTINILGLVTAARLSLLLGYIKPYMVVVESREDKYCGQYDCIVSINIYC